MHYLAKIITICDYPSVTELIYKLLMIYFFNSQSNTRREKTRENEKRCIASCLRSLDRCNACIALFGLVKTTGSIPERWRVDVRFLISEV